MKTYGMIEADFVVHATMLAVQVQIGCDRVWLPKFALLPDDAASIDDNVGEHGVAIYVETWLLDKNDIEYTGTLDA